MDNFFNTELCKNIHYDTLAALQWLPCQMWYFINSQNKLIMEITRKCLFKFSDNLRALWDDGHGPKNKL